MRKSNPNFLNGVPELLVLTFLSREEMYGYQLVKAVQIRSEQALSFGEGSIYPVLHSLVNRKLINSRVEIVNGRQRTYYKTTVKGKKELERMQGDWQQVARGISKALGVAHA